MEYIEDIDNFDLSFSEKDIAKKFKDVIRHANEELVFKVLNSKLERLALLENIIDEKKIEIKNLTDVLYIENKEALSRQRDNILMNIIIEVLSNQEE